MPNLFVSLFFFKKIGLANQKKTPANTLLKHKVRCTHWTNILSCNHVPKQNIRKYIINLLATDYMIKIKRESYFLWLQLYRDHKRIYELINHHYDPVPILNLYIHQQHQQTTTPSSPPVQQYFGNLHYEYNFSNFLKNIM